MKMQVPLPVVIAKEGKCFVASCPVLDIATQGKTEKEVKENMEDLINDFMLINFGAAPPVGETYTAIEAPKGELGFFIVSDGTGHPWKMKIRSPSAANLQGLPQMIIGSMIADVILAIGSIDPVMGEADK